MATSPAPRAKNASQIVFADAEIGYPYKSLYLDTLGDAAKKARFPNHLETASPRLGGTMEGTWRPEEHYIHGTLNTQGIEGASIPRSKLPIFGDTVHGLVKDWSNEDRSFSPRRLHPECVNRTQDTSLTTHDIEGGQRDHSNRLVTRPRGTNPLEPQYQLPAEDPQPSSCGGETATAVAAAGRNTLDVSDIEGTRARHRCRSPESSKLLVVEDIEGTTAAWRPNHKKHFGVNLRDAGLDVADINNDMPQFKLLQHTGSDFTAKGDPAGPRQPSPVKPRVKVEEQDNSLRTMDIEGVRLAVRRDNDPYINKFTRRQQKNTVTSCADIEGAQAADRDKIHLFQRRKAAAEAADAAKAAGAGVLQQLAVDSNQLEQLWAVLKKKDREGSGLVTGAELRTALSTANVQVPEGRWQPLLAGLQDNAGLVNYVGLTKQLKQRCHSAAPTVAAATAAANAGPSSSSSHPAATAATAASLLPEAAIQLDSEPTAVAAAAGKQTPTSQQLRQSSAGINSSSSSSSRPHSRQRHSSAGGAGSSSRSRGSRPSTAGTAKVVTRPASAAVAGSAWEASAPVSRQQSGLEWTNSNLLVDYYTQQLHGSSSRPCSAPAAGKHLNANRPEQFRSLSHWFGGSLRDAEAAEGLGHWRPTQDASQGLFPGTSAAFKAAVAAGLAGPQGEPVQQTAAELAATHSQMLTAAEAELGSTALPEWMLGTPDAEVTAAVQHSNRWPASTAAAAAARGAPMRPATASSGSRAAAAAAGRQASGKLRPSSATGRLGPAAAGSKMALEMPGPPGMGLAERRREVEGFRTDLAAVRLLQ